MITGPARIVVKGAVLYKGKLSGKFIEGIIQETDGHGITMDDATWIPFACISPIEVKHD